MLGLSPASVVCVVSTTVPFSANTVFHLLWPWCSQWGQPHHSHHADCPATVPGWLPGASHHPASLPPTPPLTHVDILFTLPSLHSSLLTFCHSCNLLLSC